MHRSRYDVAPLPIVELSTIRFDSNYRDEPFVLAGRVRGRCALSTTACQRAHEFVRTDSVAVRASITPSGVLRSAHVDGVLLHERVAVLLEPAAVVTQWTVDRDVVLDLGELGQHQLAAGATLTFAPDIAAAAIDRAFRATCAMAARAVQRGFAVRGAATISNAVAWAAARVALHNEPVRDLPGVLAALLTDRAERVRVTLPDLPADLLPLAAARYAAATGDLNTIVSQRATIQRAIESWRGMEAEADEIRLIRLAGLTELERTATDVGDGAWAARLHAAARAAAAATPAPMSPFAEAMRAALPLRPANGSPAIAALGSEDVAEHAWSTWAALETGRLQSGLAGADRLLVEAERPTRGAWPCRFGGEDDDGGSAALFVATVAHGLFGMEPDAPRNRIRIRPRLPARPWPMSVTGISCGDTSVRLDVAAEPDVITLTLTQESGAIPMTALLEPVVAGSIESALVDGKPASLDFGALGEGTVAPVQLVLDDRRTLQLRVRA